jgi:hypothetical protein
VRTIRFSAWLLSALTGLGAAGLAGAEHHEGGPPVVQIVSTLVGGKNVFIPSTVVVGEKRAHTLSIFNTTDKPHGFSIPSLGIEAVLPEQRETAVLLPALEGDAIHGIVCQLHEAHRTATLVVLDTD